MATKLNWSRIKYENKMSSYGVDNGTRTSEEVLTRSKPFTNHYGDDVEIIGSFLKKGKRGTSSKGNDFYCFSIRDRVHNKETQCMVFNQLVIPMLDVITGESVWFKGRFQIERGVPTKFLVNRFERNFI